ncbi:unnamed protein product [Phaeothamnion confervicola]
MADVRKEINFCKKTGISVLGVVENMSVMHLPLGEAAFTDASGQDVTATVRAVLAEKCPEALAAVLRLDVFAAFRGGPRAMAEAGGVPYLGQIPLDPNLLKACEEGVSFVEAYPTSPAAKPFAAVVDVILQATQDK